jgi:hypothetical protein
MHGICFEYDLQDWFDFKIPNTTIPSDYIVSCLENENTLTMKPSAKIVWIGGKPVTQTFTKSKKGITWEMMRLTFHDKRETIDISIESAKAKWLIKSLDLLSLNNDKTITYVQLKTDFENIFEDFELFWFSKPVKSLREYGLLVI